MNYWVKHLTDGTFVKATEKEEEQGLASWRDPAVQNIRGVEMVRNGVCILVGGQEQSPFWIVDTFDVIIGTNNQRRAGFSVKKQILESDRFFVPVINQDSMYTILFNDLSVSGNKVMLGRDLVGKWFVCGVEFLEKEYKVFCTVNDHK